MPQHELTDDQFDKIKSFYLVVMELQGVTAQDNRVFVNAVIWIFKTGAPFTPLRERTQFQRFGADCKACVSISIISPVSVILFPRNKISKCCNSFLRLKRARAPALPIELYWILSSLN